ncbi:MAG TPA: hypothetical protein VMZ71_01520 [Gemmataceae bacterium]|nr:hypothetical protein [Gemmataceae bacterium]
MPMSPYPVRCYAPGCSQPAAFKIAARWSDGLTHELKTYSLACPDCVEKLFAAAGTKRAACRLAPGETLDEPGVYELSRGGRDRALKRRADLEHR